MPKIRRKPKRRRRPLTFDDLDVKDYLDMMVGTWKSSRWRTLEAMKAAWFDVRDGFLQQCTCPDAGKSACDRYPLCLNQHGERVAFPPGKRPWAFLEFEVRPHMRRGEDEIDTMERLGLLFPGELEAIEKNWAAMAKDRRPGT